MRRCRWCDHLIRPKPLPRGGVEAPSQWKGRKFCSRHCWREWLRDRIHRTAPDKLERLERAALAARRFNDGDPIWYQRKIDGSFGWPVRVPAEFVRYLDDFGRARVVITVFSPDGAAHPVWTTERKLLPRAASLADLVIAE